MSFNKLTAHHIIRPTRQVTGCIVHARACSWFRFLPWTRGWATELNERTGANESDDVETLFDRKVSGRQPAIAIMDQATLKESHPVLLFSLR